MCLEIRCLNCSGRNLNIYIYMHVKVGLAEFVYVLYIYIWLKVRTEKLPKGLVASQESN